MSAACGGPRALGGLADAGSCQPVGALRQHAAGGGPRNRRVGRVQATLAGHRGHAVLPCLSRPAAVRRISPWECGGGRGAAFGEVASCGRGGDAPPGAQEEVVGRPSTLWGAERERVVVAVPAEREVFARLVRRVV